MLSAHTTGGSSAVELPARKSSGTSRSAYKVATLPTPSGSTRAMKAVVVWLAGWTGSITRYCYRLDGLRLLWCQPGLAVRSKHMKSAIRNSLCAAGNQQHHSRPALHLQEYQQSRKSRVAPDWQRSKVRIVETFVEYLPRPRQLGSSPDPLGGRAAPPRPPGSGRRLRRRRDCCRYMPARTLFLDTAPLIRALEGLEPSRSTRCSAQNKHRRTAGPRCAPLSRSATAPSHGCPR
jgi:hypothetical protein